MSEEIKKVGMKPSHPGEFIREEILAELGLSVARAAEILGVRRATLSDLVNCHAALSPVGCRLGRKACLSENCPCEIHRSHDTSDSFGRAPPCASDRFRPCSKSLPP